MRVEPGTVVDRYTIERLLGRGGMALVYLARHNQLGSRHAIKVLSVPTPAIQDRLLREGRAQSTLNHPNIVTVTDVIAVGGTPGLVMEYIEGPSLEQLLHHRRLTLDEADRFARGILRGVGAAHRHGLVHRDLKPGNVLVAPGDLGLVPKLTDFGLAKLLSPEIGATSTRSGVPMGTPSYMAPEQIRDAGGVDERADVFALGCILYELVTGVRAFKGADMIDIFRMITEGRYQLVRELVPDLPDRMEAAIVGALRIDPAERIPDVEALLRAWCGGDPQERELSSSWDPAMVSAVRELARIAPAPLPPRPVSGSTFDGGAGSSDTWAAATGLGVALAPQVAVEPVVASPAPWRRAPWLLVAAAVVMIAVGTWWTAGGPADGPTLLNAGAVPVLIDDAVLQQELELGWKALLDADFKQAERRLGVVVASDPVHPFPWWAWERTLRYVDRSGESVPAFWRGVERGAALGGPEAELAAALDAARQGGWTRGGDALRAWLQAHPDDLLVRLQALSLAEQGAVTEADALLAEIRALDPDGALVHWILARRQLGLEDFAAAAETVEVGLAKNPGSPALLTVRGDVLLRQGAITDARAAFVAALDNDPGLLSAQRGLAVSRLMAGDEGVHAEIDAALASSARWNHKVRTVLDMSDALYGLGRAGEAIALLERADAEATAAGEWATVMAVRGRIPVLLWLAHDVEGTAAATLRLHDLSMAPELPDSERENLVRNLLYAQGIVAALRGDVAEAEAILTRLKAIDRVWPVFIEYLSREVAIARRDPVEVARWFEHLPPTCLGDLERGYDLWRAGDGAAAALVLEPRVADPSACTQIGEGRFRLAAAHVVLAEQALAEGDRARATTLLEGVDGLWPAPDPDLRIVRLARDLAPTPE